MQHNKIDREKVVAALNTVCPSCGFSIPPAEVVRIDFERMRCPKCGFVCSRVCSYSENEEHVVSAVLRMVLPFAVPARKRSPYTEDVNQSKAIEKGRQFAQTAYAQQQNDILREHQQKIALSRNNMAARGVLMSSTSCFLRESR